MSQANETPDQKAARVQADLAEYRARPLPDDYLRAVAYDLAADVRTLYAQATALQLSLGEALQAAARAAAGAAVAKQQDPADRAPLPDKLVQPKVGV